MKNCDAVNLSTAISSVTVVLNILLNAVFIFELFGAPAGIKVAPVMLNELIWGGGFTNLPIGIAAAESRLFQ